AGWGRGGGRGRCQEGRLCGRAWRERGRDSPRQWFCRHRLCRKRWRRDSLCREWLAALVAAAELDLAAWFTFSPRSRVGAVAFLVFFAGAAGAGIVAADFGAGADGLGRFGLSGAGLVLQFLFLALLTALHVAGEWGQARGSFMDGACCGAGDCRGCSGQRALLRTRRSGSTL